MTISNMQHNPTSVANDTASNELTSEAFISRLLFFPELPPTIREEDIREKCVQYGELRKVNLYSSKLVAFVEYYDIRDAENARTKLRADFFHGMPIRCQYSRTRDDRSHDGNTGTLYVRPVTSERNFIDSNTLEQYKELFNTFGEVKKVNCNRKREAEKFVEYYDLRASEEALDQLNGYNFNGVVLEVQFANQSSKTLNREVLNGGIYNRQDNSSSRANQSTRSNTMGAAGGMMLNSNAPQQQHMAAPDFRNRDGARSISNNSSGSTASSMWKGYANAQEQQVAMFPRGNSGKTGPSAAAAGFFNLSGGPPSSFGPPSDGGGLASADSSGSSPDFSRGAYSPIMSRGTMRASQAPAGGGPMVMGGGSVTSTPNMNRGTNSSRASPYGQDTASSPSSAAGPSGFGGWGNKVTPLPPAGEWPASSFKNNTSSNDSGTSSSFMGGGAGHPPPMMGVVGVTGAAPEHHLSGDSSSTTTSHTSPPFITATTTKSSLPNNNIGTTNIVGGGSPSTMMMMSHPQLDRHGSSDDHQVILLRCSSNTTQPSSPFNTAAAVATTTITTSPSLLGSAVNNKNTTSVPPTTATQITSGVLSSNQLITATKASTTTQLSAAPNSNIYTTQQQPPPRTTVSSSTSSKPGGSAVVGSVVTKPMPPTTSSVFSNNNSSSFPPYSAGGDSTPATASRRQDDQTPTTSSSAFNDKTNNININTPSFDEFITTTPATTGNNNNATPCRILQDPYATS